MVEFLTWLNSLMSWLVQNVFVALLVGVLTGITAGVVVSRLAKFEELRNEARQIIWGIDWIEEDNRLKFRFKREPGELVYISSELFALKHQNAGELINTLLAEIDKAIYLPSMTSEEMSVIYSKWQRDCRELKPDRQTIFAINWKL